MVENYPGHVDRAFHALSDQTRRAILYRLATGGGGGASGSLTVGHLAAPFEMSLAAVSKHIQVLVDAGLVSKERDGRVRRCAMNFDGLRDATEVVRWFQKFWGDQLDSLER